MPDNSQIVELAVTELGVDKCNIREGVWDCDEELISSIRKKGIIQPLVVRPIHELDGVNYGIVCGSRRYNAAVEAGLETIPCVIRGLSDIEAMEESMCENRMRSDTPTWMDIEYVGMMYTTHQSNGLSHQEARDTITRTGMSTPTVERYLRIYKLPEEVKGLMRDPADRTKTQKEAINLYCAREPFRPLPIGHADLLSQIGRLPIEKQMEVAIFIMNRQQGKTTQLIQLVKDNPTINVEELYKRILKEYGIIDRRIQLEKTINDALGVVCMQKQIQADILIVRIIKEWLIEHGFLGKIQALKEETSDIKTVSKINHYILTSAGYKILKREVDTDIYQKPIKKGSGFIKIFMHKSGNGLLKITAGSYDDDQAEEILLRERDLIEDIKKHEKKITVL